MKIFNSLNDYFLRIYVCIDNFRSLMSIIVYLPQRIRTNYHRIKTTQQSKQKLLKYAKTLNKSKQRSLHQFNSDNRFVRVSKKQFYLNSHTKQAKLD